MFNKLKITKRKNLPELIAFSDSQLISYYKSSDDKEAVGVLFKRYTHLVYAISLKYLKNKEDSKDVVMQVFEKLFTDLQKHEVENFKAWLAMVVRNHCLMILRKTKQELAVEDPAVFSFSKENMENEEDVHLLNDYSGEQLKMAISKLKIEQKTCIELFYLHDKSYVEISEITGFDNNKVKSYIQNGKRNLKILLTKNTDE